MKTTFRSPAISCGGCARNIKAALGTAPGVRDVEVDPSTKVVSIDFDESATDRQKLSTALGEAGYPPQQSGS